MRRSFAYAVALTIALAACGSRVVPLGQDFSRGGTGPTNTTTGGQATTTGGLTTGTATTGGQTTGTTTGGQTTGTTTTGGLAPNCKGGATDVGVTATSIKLGLIASKTGPLRGQFNSAIEAVDAYFKGLNAAGGICGRKVQLIIKDDGGNGPNNLSIAEKMSRQEKVFAFVGSHSAPDDSGIAKVSRRDKIPDIGFPLTWERTESPYTYGVPGQVQRRWIGQGASGSKYLNKANNIKQIAIFWLRESEVSILSAWAFETAMKSATNNQIEICFEQPTGVLDNNYTNYVISMKGKCDPADGNIAVYSTMENNANIKLARAMKSQNFKYTFFAPTFTSYHPDFIDPKKAGNSTEGAYIAMPQIPLERLERPQSEWTKGTVELKRYMDTLRRYYPRPTSPGSFGGPAWGSASLFATAAAACGANLTRRCLLDKIDAMSSFSADGFLTATRPSAHRVYTSDLIVQVRNGRFVEIRPQDKSGPKESPDFWDRSELMNWWDYYCKNKSEFPNTGDKDRYIKC